MSDPQAAGAAASRISARVQRAAKNRLSVFERLQPKTVLALLLIFGFVFRLFLLRYRFAIAFDEVNYIKLGVSGHLKGLSAVLHTYWSPLLPTLIAFFCGLFRDYEFAARLVSVLAGTLLAIPVYFLGKLVYDKNAGLLAAAFVTLFPPLAFQSTQILTEPVYMLLAATAIFFGLRMLKMYSTGFAMLAGIAAGLAYLAHPQGVGFFILLTFWIIFGSLTRLFLINRLRILWMLLPLAFGFLLVAAPYLWYLKRATGTWTFSAKASANLQMEARETPEGDPFRSLNAENTSVPIDQIFHEGNFLNATDGGQTPVRQVRLAPFLKKYAENVSNVLQSAIPEVLTTIPLLLLGVGLLGSPWQPQQGKLVLYLLSFVGFFWLGVIPAFHITARYLTPLLPICALWVGRGAQQIYQWLSVYMPLFKFSKRINVLSSNTAFVLMAAAFLLLTFAPELGRVVSRHSDSRDVWADPVEQKIAGRWLKENVSGPKIIMSRNHAVDVYAGNFDIKESVTIPKGSFERVLAYAKHKRVNYLLINERYTKFYPELSFLLETTDATSGLNLIYDKKDPSGLITRIFKVQ
jgi:4-amino-4-deoxy-L-arabinose transferase-like glycosyltransferase